MSNHEVPPFSLRVVTAHPGNVFTASPDVQFATKRSAQDAAERLQEAFDEDCEPRRAYVVDACGVAVEAAGRPARAFRKVKKK